jgi:hypothetical protein
MSAALCAALLVAAAPPEQRRTGTVVYATQRRLYLDAGARDGLAQGAVLQLRRKGRPAGSCTVETLGEARSTCAGTGLPGDVFDLTPPPPLPEPQVTRAAPPEPVPLVEQRKAAVTAVSFEKVDFHGGPEVGAGTRAEVAIAHASWAAIGFGPWHQERADVALRDGRLGRGFTVDVELSARRWTLRSDPVSFRPDDREQLYVWEAAISRRAQEGGFAMSVGRVRPRYVPGQVIFDGAEAGWRTAGGSEVGLFGGAVPDEVTLAPSLEHGTFGAFWSGQHAGDADSVLRVFRHEARVAFVNSASLGKRVEGEALVQLFLTRRFDAAAAVRVGRREREGTESLDAVRIDGNLGPFDGLSFNGGFRYDGLSIPELDGPGNVRFGGAARHADLSAEWQPAEALRIWERGCSPGTRRSPPATSRSTAGRRAAAAISNSSAERARACRRWRGCRGSTPSAGSLPSRPTISPRFSASAPGSRAACRCGWQRWGAAPSTAGGTRWARRPGRPAGSAPRSTASSEGEPRGRWRSFCRARGAPSIVGRCRPSTARFPSTASRRSS